MKLIISILLVLLLIVFSGCIGNKSQDTPIHVDLTRTENITNTEPDDVFKIGVSTMLSPKETLSEYQELVDYIGKRLGKNTLLVQRSSYEQMNELIENKSVNAAFICSGPYIEGHDKFGMELIAVPQMYNDTVYYSYIIVNKNSSIETFRELKGKKFAFTDPKSNSGKLVPTYALGKMNETPDTFFKEYIFTGSHDNSIDAVANELVDGASVDHLIWKYLNKYHPEKTSRTKIIGIYGPFGMKPFVVHPDTDPKLKERLRSIMLEMDKDESGKNILARMEIDRFVLINDSSYTSIREMASWEKSERSNKSRI